METITGKFVQGERGPICQKPSDRGAWIVPAKGTPTPELGVEYVLEIVGGAQSGRLRFARAVETVEVWKKRLQAEYLPLVRAALKRPDEVIGRYAPYPGEFREGVTVLVKGRTFQLVSASERLSRSERMALAPFLICAELNVRFKRADYPMAEAAMEKARLDYEAEQERERQERAVREAEYQAKFNWRQVDRQDIASRVKSAIVGFVPRSGNERLAKLILDAVGIEGATVRFFTGGDDSEPEGALIEMEGMLGHIEVAEVSQLVDWRDSSEGSYQRYRDYPSFSSTGKFCLDEAGEAIPA